MSGYCDSLQSRSQRPGVGIAVIVTNKLHPNKVLVGQRKNVIGSGLYQLPGGHLEFGETWEEGARREVKEETGLSLKVVQFCHVVNTVKREYNYHYVTIFMKAEVKDFDAAEPQNLEPEKCEGWEWIDWKNLPHESTLFWSLKDFYKSGINPFQM